jgi:hypothetical protein
VLGTADKEAMMWSRMIVAPIGLLLLAGCEWGQGFLLPESALRETPSSVFNPTDRNHATLDAAPDVRHGVFSPTPLNRVLLDLANDRAYVANREGGLDAVRLHDGLRCWSSAAAQRPIAMCQEGVLCLCGGAADWSVALLNTNSGNPIWVSEPFGVPGDGLFCEARWEQTELICSWRTESRQVGGGGKEGVVRIDFRTGRVIAGNSQPQWTSAAGTEPQQPMIVGNRAYSVSEEVEVLRFLEARDAVTGKRLWRYAITVRAGSVSDGT